MNSAVPLPATQMPPGPRWHLCRTCNVAPPTGKPGESAPTCRECAGKGIVPR